MVENWDQTRKNVPDAQAVMITDASNKEREEINAMAQERRDQASELGSHRVELPEKPYGLASGDEVMFTSQYRIPGQKRVENGITGTIVNTSRDYVRHGLGTTREQPIDKIGWAKTVPPVAVPIHLDGDCWALMRALDGAQEFADEEIYEVSRDTDGQSLACERERIRELYDFTDDVRGRIDIFAVQEGAHAIPDLVA